MHQSRRLSLPVIGFQTVYAAFVLMVLMAQFFFWISPTHREAVSIIYLWPAAIALYSLMLYRERERLAIGMRPLAAMVIWTFLTCILNGDYYLTYNRQFMLGVVLAVGVCYPALLVMPQLRRERWLLIISTVLVGLLTLLCWLSFYAVLTRTLIQSPFGGQPLGIDPAIGDGRLYVFGEHPNGMACIFSIGLFLAIYLFFRIPKLWSRILCVIAMLSLFSGVAMTLSRTVAGTISAGAGLLTVLCTLRVCRISRKSLRVLVCISAAIVTIFLTFAAYQLTVDAMAGLSAQAEGMETLAVRDFTEELGTLNKRDEIWMAGLRKIRERPVTLLIGMLDSQVSRLPGNMLGRNDAFHMHNTYLEILMVTGLIGLGLALWFMVTLALACIRLYFRAGVPFAARVLAIIPFMLMLNGMLEAYPFLGGRLMDMLFFVIAGAVIAWEKSCRNAAA